MAAKFFFLPCRECELPALLRLPGREEEDPIGAETRGPILGALWGWRCRAVYLYADPCELHLVMGDFSVMSVLAVVALDPASWSSLWRCSESPSRNQGWREFSI